MHKKIIGVIVILIGLGLSACGRPAPPQATPMPTPTPSPFVTVSDGKFSLAGQPYYFVGVNFWQGMNLGVAGPGGNRTQLVKELEQLQQLGVTNLRIMAAAEGPDTEPYRLTPALQISPGEYNEQVLDGLDYLLAQMGPRGLRAVMVLNNYWHWSGGMAQYVAWHENTAIPYPGDWGVFMDYAAKFYTCPECQTWYRHHIETLVDHTNPYTGLTYRDDPTIFAWELANEPRRYPVTWVNETAAYIKSLDPHHLVTTGSEGSPPGERQQDFKETHAGAHIDYATIHIWPQNWGWYDPLQPSTYSLAESSARTYFQTHATEAATLHKPLVLEEFGLARDWEPLHNLYSPEAPTTYRDLFCTAMFEAVYTSISTGGPVGGDNVWAWAGQARPGDPWVGDPPHETPGWYSIYNTDTSTLTILATHAQALAQAQTQTQTGRRAVEAFSLVLNEPRR